MAKSTKVPNKNAKSAKSNFGDHKCKICNKRFSDSSGLAHHVQLHSSDRPYSCNLCSYTCKTKKYLTKHVKTVHKAATEHACTYCDRKFHYKSLLENHMYIHTDERPYKCDVCGKGFNTTYSLNTHKYIHTDMKPFKCQYCDYACRDNSTLRKHEERHRGITRRYQCKMCDKSYKTKRVLKIHIAEAHLDMKVKNRPCKECGKMFKSNTTLNTHIKLVHEKKYSCKCDICGVVISNKYNMAAHLTKHVHFKPFKCTFDGCTKKFKDKSTLRKHSIIHYPDKQFVCSLCDRRFTRINRLNVHMKQHRHKEKCVICDYCGTSFYNKNYLRNHITKKHCINEKFICDKCGFLTYNKPSLVMHIKYGHAFEMDRQCKICKKNFKKHQYLKLHYWNTHCIKYNRMPRRPKPKKKKLIIKEEPIDMKEMELLHEVKVEPLSDSDPDTKSTEYSRSVLSEDISRVVNEKRTKKNTPVTRFEDFFIEHIMKPDSNVQAKVKIKPVNKTQLKEIYNNLILEEKSESKSQNHKELSKNGKIKNHVQEINYVDNEIKGDETFDDENYKGDESIENDDLNDPDYVVNSDGVGLKRTNNLKRIKNYKDDDDSIKNDDLNDPDYVVTGDQIGDGIGDEKTNQSKRIKINTHQCYVCFKLYDTKEKLIDHCQEHFDLCNVAMLKKCPLCDYVTRLNLPRHMLLVHKINIKITNNSIEDRKNSNNGSRFYYKVQNDKVNEIEIIPSVKNLNRQAYIALDKQKRELNDKGLTKTKLVKKNGEWVIEKEKTKPNIIHLPKIKQDGTDYLEKIKLLSKIAKNNGQKIMFPCEKCDKICQTLSALKLHTRKHELNPKPFRKKVWKHKLTELELRKINEKPNIINLNRYAKPKPIVHKHKCDPKLKEFYENNIKGGDIEFWHFLKIFNKMSRDNVNDFADLENRKEFGMHIDLPVTSDIKTGIKNKTIKNAFKRTIMISKRSHQRRKVMIDILRRNIRNNS